MTWAFVAACTVAARQVTRIESCCYSGVLIQHRLKGGLNLLQHHLPPPTPSYSLSHEQHFFFSCVTFSQLLSICCFISVSAIHPIPPFISLMPPIPTSLTLSLSMRYSCDPPAVRRLALAQLKSCSVLLLARVVGLPHSQFTRLPQPLCAEEGGCHPERVWSQGGNRSSDRVCRA